MFSNDCSLGLALTNEHHGCVTPCQYLIASKLTAECGDHNNQKICELAKIPGLVFSGYWPPLTEPTFAHSAALVTQGSLKTFAADLVEAGYAGLSCRSLPLLSLRCDCEGLWNEGRKADLGCVCEGSVPEPQKQPFSPSNRAPHAAPRTKVSCAQGSNLDKAPLSGQHDNADSVQLPLRMLR